MEQPVDPRTPEELKEALGDFMHDHFRPAKDAGEARLMYTTDILYDKVNSHSPELIPKPAMRQALLDLGYNEAFIGEQFVWLLKMA